MVLGINSTENKPEPIFEVRKISFLGSFEFAMAVPTTSPDWRGCQHNRIRFAQRNGHTTNLTKDHPIQGY